MSGVNWMRENFASIAALQAPHHHRLAQARHAFEQHVAAGEQRGHDAVDDVGLADHHLVDARFDVRINRAEARGGLARFTGANRAHRDPLGGDGGAGVFPRACRKYCSTNDNIHGCSSG